MRNKDRLTLILRRWHRLQLDLRDLANPNRDKGIAPVWAEPAEGIVGEVDMSATPVLEKLALSLISWRSLMKLLLSAER